MLDLAKDTRPKTLCDCLGLFCFLGCLLATVGLSFFGIVNVWRKGLCLEAIDALLSMLKLLALNCSLLLVLWAVFYFCHQKVLGGILIAQHFLVFLSIPELDISFSSHLTEDQKLLFLPFALTFVVRLGFTFFPWWEKRAMPFVRRAVSKGATVPLLASYGLAALFIALTALGVFGLLASPVTLFGKMAASVVACGVILCLAIAARLLRVLHVAKMMHSRGLLGSLQSDKVAAFVISHHLGSTFFSYVISCIPLMTAAIICISIEGWNDIVTLESPFITMPIMLFPTYDAICGTRMLIRKKSIWDEWRTALALYMEIPACSVPITLLKDTGFVSSFGSLVFAHKLGLRLFGGAPVLNPYSILTCTVIYLANSILCANMAAESPAQIGIYLNAPHAANVEEISESEFAETTSRVREYCS